MAVSPSPKARVLVIIVTYNGQKWVDSCLGNLRNSHLPVDVLVVDNGSTDETPALIREHYPEVSLVEPGENLGFGKGNNLGLVKALEEGYEYAFLLNQDAWVAAETLGHLIEVQQAHPEYGVLSPMHLNGAGDKLDRHFADYVVPHRCSDLYSDLYVRPENMQPVYETEFVNAAAWLLSRECIETIGGFDPIFPHYGEDVDYLNRVSYHKIKIGICPAVTIHHDRNTQKRIGPFDTPKKYVHLCFVKALARLKDPRTNLTRSLLREYKEVIFGTVESLFSARERKRQRMLWQGLFRATSRLSQIRKHKRISQQRQANFLSTKSAHSPDAIPA